MGLVAVSNVATTTQNLGTSKVNSQSDDGFSQVLKSSISAQKNQQQQNVTTSQTDNKKSSNVEVKDNQSESVKDIKDDGSNTTENTPTKKKDEQNDTDPAGAVAAQVNQNQEQLDDVKKTVEEAVKEIANCLGITQNELLNMIQNLKMSFEDLFTTEGLKKLVSNSFGLTSSVDLLNNSKAFDAFKQIGQKIQELIDEKHLDSETVKSIMSDVDNTSNLTQTLQAGNANLLSQKQQNDTETTQQTGQIEQTSQTQTGDSNDITINIEDLRSKAENQDGQQHSSEKGNQSDFLGQFENQLQNISTKGSDVITPTDIKDMVEQAANAKEILNQVVNQVKIALEDDQTTMSIQLKPENLGKIAFSLRSQNGVLTGHFVAENNAVKEAIEMNLSSLKASLTEQGIKFDEVKVVVGNTNQFFEQNDQSRAFNQSSNNKRRRSSSNQTVESVGQKITDIRDAMNVQELENDEHMVDYSA